MSARAAGRLGSAVTVAVTVVSLLTPADATAQAGADLFAASCAQCHSDAQSGRTPSRASLGALTPRAVVAALSTAGVMSAEGESFTPEQRIALAEFLTRRPYEASVLPETAFCATRGFAPVDLQAIGWMGYGGDLEGTGHQSAARAGLRAADVPNLRLRWAFAFPDASQARTKPTVVGDVTLVADEFGVVYALEAASGCVRWTFEADAGVRGAVLVGESEGRQLAYFVDSRTSAYALDLASGELAWKERVGWHPENNTTGSPALAAGKLIVPISSMEVARAASPTYECCTSSGAVAALDAATGSLEWYHLVIPDEAIPVGTSSAGTRIFAPSGAPVWSSPTVDTLRGLVYVGTGEHYTRPTTHTSDAILALDLETGDLAWSFQATEDDAYTIACGVRAGPGCPSPPGPDHDFGMAPMLVTRDDGKQVLVAGQKSGTVWALDPDDDGALLWSRKVGKGGALGGIHWGMAADGRLAYAPVADRAVVVDVSPEMPPSPGLYALDLGSGELLWSAPAPRDTCAGRRGCFAALSAAATSIDSVVFVGGLDGHLRAYATSDGRVLWDVDTTAAVETVNGVPGRGGAIDGPGPVIANGLVLVNSGYGSFGQMPGNLLLAYSRE
ncbi:MAG: dehydrogenase [Gemmatimonadetes bacterium]|nr:dehydrogenase [Gemmatimonadota bacterium]